MRLFDYRTVNDATGRRSTFAPTRASVSQAWFSPPKISLTLVSSNTAESASAMIGAIDSTVSASQRGTVREYIARQEDHHRKRTFQEEYVELLTRSGVEYDERYLW